MTLDNLGTDNLDDLIAIEIASNGLPVTRKKVRELMIYLEIVLETLDQTEIVMQNPKIKKELDESFDRVISEEKSSVKQRNKRKSVHKPSLSHIAIVQRFAQRYYEVSQKEGVHSGSIPIIHDGEKFIQDFCQEIGWTEEEFWVKWKEIVDQGLGYIEKIPQRKSYGLIFHQNE